MPTVPAGNDAVLIVGGDIIVMLSAFVAATLAVSVTFAVKSNDPAVVGVPEIDPAAEIVNPGGRLPAAMDQLYGGVPPLAESACV